MASHGLGTKRARNTWRIVAGCVRGRGAGCLTASGAGGKVRGGSSGRGFGHTCLRERNSVDSRKVAAVEMHVVHMELG